MLSLQSHTRNSLHNCVHLLTFKIRLSRRLNDTTQVVLTCYIFFACCFLRLSTWPPWALIEWNSFSL